MISGIEIIEPDFIISFLSKDLEFRRVGFLKLLSLVWLWNLKLGLFDVVYFR